MNQGLLVQVTQKTLALVTSHAGIFQPLGMALFRNIATILIILEGLQIAFWLVPAQRFARLLFMIGVVDAMMLFYQTPLPGVGSNLTQIVTDTGVSMAAQIDTTIAQQVGAQASLIGSNMQGTGWNWSNPGAVIRLYMFEIGLALMQFVMLGVLAFGFIAVGILVLLGQVAIPFLLVPGFDYIATGWVRSLIQYSLYPLIGNAFIWVYGNVWMNFTSQLTGPMDTETMAQYFVEFLVLTGALVFGILRIPQFIAGWLGGASASVLPSIGWWR